MTKLDKGSGSHVGNRSSGVLTQSLAKFTNLPIPNLHCHNLVNNHKQPGTYNAACRTAPATLGLLKLDGVGPVDNRPSPD